MDPMKRPAAVLLALALAGSLAGCGGDDNAGEERPVSVGVDATESPVPGLSPAPSATGSPTASPVAEPSSATPAPSGAVDEQTAAEPFPADTGVDVQEPTGGPLTVTAVRVAAHEGYDRVVFELAGRQPGEPGWRVEYVDDPTQQGSGDPVDVQGEAALSVTITGTGYPFDTGQEEVSTAPPLPSDLTAVTDLELGGVFEGQYEAFIGTSGQAPFRVFRLSDPARVVVDVQTS
jgi:hypothetical protein